MSGLPRMFLTGVGFFVIRTAAIFLFLFWSSLGAPGFVQAAVGDLYRVEVYLDWVQPWTNQELVIDDLHCGALLQRHAEFLRNVWPGYILRPNFSGAVCDYASLPVDGSTMGSGLWGTDDVAHYALWRVLEVIPALDWTNMSVDTGIAIAGAVLMLLAVAFIFRMAIWALKSDESSGGGDVG